MHLEPSTTERTTSLTVPYVTTTMATGDEPDVSARRSIPEDVSGGQPPSNRSALGAQSPEG